MSKLSLACRLSTLIDSIVLQASGSVPNRLLSDKSRALRDVRVDHSGGRDESNALPLRDMLTREGTLDQAVGKDPTRP